MKPNHTVNTQRPIDVGVRTSLDAMVAPVPRPTRAAIDAYWDLVTTLAHSERRQVDRTREEIIAVLNAAGKRPGDLVSDVDAESTTVGRRQRDCF